MQDECALRRDVDLAVDNDGVYAAIGGAGCFVADYGIGAVGDF